MAENDYSKHNLSSVSTLIDIIYQFCDMKCPLKLSSIPFNLPSVQVSKTDPSPKREMPTMILFNVVFALRVRKVVVFVFLHLYIQFNSGAVGVVQEGCVCV